MSDKDSKKTLQVEENKTLNKEVVKQSSTKKTPVKKPVAKKPVKSLLFQGREVEIIAETNSRKGHDWDLVDLRFIGEERVFRIKRKLLDK